MMLLDVGLAEDLIQQTLKPGTQTFLTAEVKAELILLGTGTDLLVGRH